MYEAAARCKDIAGAPVTNWEPHCVTLAGYCYVVRHGMKVQLVTPYRVSHLQRYGVTVRGNFTSVYPRLAYILPRPLSSAHLNVIKKIDNVGSSVSELVVICLLLLHS